MHNVLTLSVVHGDLKIFSTRTTHYLYMELSISIDEGLKIKTARQLNISAIYRKKYEFPESPGKSGKLFLKSLDSEASFIKMYKHTPRHISPLALSMRKEHKISDHGAVV
jgi:hypothetical protein